MSSDLHRLVIDQADANTGGLASETSDLDSYLLALMQLVLSGDVPCDIATLTALRNLAEADGFS